MNHPFSNFRWVTLLLLGVTTLLFFWLVRARGPSYGPDSISYLYKLPIVSDYKTHGLQRTLALGPEFFFYKDLTYGLGSQRTLAYPLFIGLLREAHLFEQAHIFQFLAFFLANLCLYFGLIQVGVPRLFCFLFCALGPLVNLSVLNLNYSYNPDGPSLSLGLLAVAALLLTVAAPQRRWPWALLTFATTAAYQMRPAYLFLVFFIPLSGYVLFRWCHPGDKAAAARALGTLLALHLLPLFLFCVVRKITVDDFGLVSFGGYNVSAVTSQLLTPSLIERMSPRFRPFAYSVLSLQKRPENWPNPYEGSPRQWQSAWKAESQLDYQAIEAQHTAAARIARIAVIETTQPKPSWVSLNRFLAQFDKEVIWLAPLAYGRWVAHCLFKCLKHLLTKGAGLGGSLLVLAASSVFILGKQLGLPIDSRLFFKRTFPIWFLASFFFVSNAITISATGLPIHRYLICGAYFLRIAPFLLLAGVLQSRAARALLGDVRTYFTPVPENP